MWLLLAGLAWAADLTGSRSRELTARWDATANGPVVSVQVVIPAKVGEAWFSVGAGRMTGSPSLRAAAGWDADVLTVPVGFGAQGVAPGLGGHLGWRAGLHFDVPGAVGAGSAFVRRVEERDGMPGLARVLVVFAFPLELEGQVRLLATDRVAISAGARFRYSALGLTLARDMSHFWAPMFVPSVGLEVRLGGGGGR
ncbi:MAG: hypothetical protein H6737_18790 [Alphaproteobacteria bacterium]|nr:hypothetical protein [Alphaproteobacteria bacterium]